MTKAREMQINTIKAFITENAEYYTKAVVYEDSADDDNRDLELAVFVRNVEDATNFELLSYLTEVVDSVTQGRNQVVVANHPGVPEYLKEEIDRGIIIYDE